MTRASKVGVGYRNVDHGGASCSPALDARLTALLCGDRRFPACPAVLSDAEVICLAVAQVLLSCPSERRFVPLARRRLGHLFPVVLGQSGYNKRVRALAPKIAMVLSWLARSSPSWCDNLRRLDSTPVPCAASRETVKRSDFAVSVPVRRARECEEPGVPARLFSWRAERAGDSRTPTARGARSCRLKLTLTPGRKTRFRPSSGSAAREFGASGSPARLAGAPFPVATAVRS
jgi:hypothetical protein